MSSNVNTQQLDDFLYETNQIQRERAINRVLTAFRLNALDVLDLPSEPTPSQIKKQYRKLSLLCHPDKCKPEFREKAQQAFTLLAASKAEWTEEDKREHLNKFITKAREKVTNRKLDRWRKLQKEKRKELMAAVPQQQMLLNAEAKREAAAKLAAAFSKVEPPDFTKDTDFEMLVRAEVKELIIEREWKKRQLMKAAQREETIQAELRKEEEEKNANEAEEKKKWEDGREKRINSWRNFMNKSKKKKKRKM